MRLSAKRVFDGPITSKRIGLIATSPSASWPGSTFSIRLFLHRSCNEHTLARLFLTREGIFRAPRELLVRPGRPFVSGRAAYFLPGIRATIASLALNSDCSYDKALWRGADEVERIAGDECHYVH